MTVNVFKRRKQRLKEVIYPKLHNFRAQIWTQVKGSYRQEGLRAQTEGLVIGMKGRKSRLQGSLWDSTGLDIIWRLAHRKEESRLSEIFKLERWFEWRWLNWRDEIQKGRRLREENNRCVWCQTSISNYTAETTKEPWSTENKPASQLPQMNEVGTQMKCTLNNSISL